MIEIMKSITRVNISCLGIFVFFVGCHATLGGRNLAEDSDPMRGMNLSAPITLSEQQLPYQPQGITGIVLSLQGDRMPVYAPNQSRLDPQPVSTKIWIFSGKISSPGSPFWNIKEARQHPNLIGWVQSDSAGRFEVGLPPGEYTIFEEYGTDLYLNEFSADGSFVSIQVKAHQLTEVNLINTTNVTF